MKGDFHWGIYFGLVAGIIALLLALSFLPLPNLDALFLSNDQRILKQYATCALAYCAAGGVGTNNQTSDEVNAVGCLKFQGGNCNVTCAQVEKEVYLKNGVQPTVQEIGGRGAYHYCGPKAALTFEFSGVSLGGTVPLRSGQMDKLATSPQWVCKPIKVPFTDVDLDSLPVFNLVDTAFAQFTGSGAFPQNCIILSGKKSFLFPGRDGCFQAIKYDKSYDSIYYTPIIEYDSGNQIIYPSAIYVDQKFTTTLQGSSEPECNYQNQPNHQAVSDEEITQKIKDLVNARIGTRPTSKTYGQEFEDLGKVGNKTICGDSNCTYQITQAQKDFVDKIISDGLGGTGTQNNLIGNVLNSCKFKTTYNGKKITYKVWAKPVYPTFDALAEASGVNGFEKFIGNILKSTSPQLFDALKFLKEAQSSGATLIASQLGGSCTAVVLGRDLNDNSITNQNDQTTTSQATYKIISLVTDKNSYSAGDVVKVSGIVSMPASQNGVKLGLQQTIPTLGTQFISDQTAIPDSSGNFKSDFKLGDKFSGKYTIVTTYGTDKKSVDFDVK